MSLYDELDLLDEAQHEAERAAETMRFDNDVDRRKFVFLSLATAAATTFGFGAKSVAQGRGGDRVAQAECGDTRPRVCSLRRDIDGARCETEGDGGSTNGGGRQWRYGC